MEALRPYLLALGIGLMLGTERERSHPKGSQALGLRSFVLLALLGAFTSGVEEPLLRAVIALFAGAAVLLGYWRSTAARAAADIGLTTELAAAANFALGYLARTQPLTALGLAAIILLLLVAGEPLHRFSRQSLRKGELEAGAILLSIAFGLAPLLPETALDPWGLFAPRRFAWILFAVLALQFGGYVASRWFGASRGLAATAFLAGLVSSTVALLSFARRSREEPSRAPALSAAALAASCGSLFELALLLLIADRALGLRWLAPCALGGLGGWVLARGALHAPQDGAPSEKALSPLRFAAALKLAALLAALFAISSALKHWLGAPGAYALALASGWAELQAVCVAIAQLHARGELAPREADLAILLAWCASLCAKSLLAFWIGSRSFAQRVLWMHAAVAALLVGALFAVTRLWT